MKTATSSNSWGGPSLVPTVKSQLVAAKCQCGSAGDVSRFLAPAEKNAILYRNPGTVFIRDRVIQIYETWCAVFLHIYSLIERVGLKIRRVLRLNRPLLWLTALCPPAASSRRGDDVNVMVVLPCGVSVHVFRQLPQFSRLENVCLCSNTPSFIVA